MQTDLPELFSIDTVQKLDQLLQWVYKGTSVKAFGLVANDNQESSDENLARPETWYRFAINEDFDLTDDMDDPAELVLPRLRLGDSISLALPLTMRNPHGINRDNRGVKEAFEFEDFYRSWEVQAGPIKIVELLQACYKLKSHKFDNWYEWVQGASCSIVNGRFIAKLRVDHGS
ncbi:MAG: hypothetical protein H0X02_13815 [Nitrosomonas sp.]|nr:hypothetical protein [Nitrosomonas sp.]